MLTKFIISILLLYSWKIWHLVVWQNFKAARGVTIHNLVLPLLYHDTVINRIACIYILPLVAVQLFSNCTVLVA